jgi:hypothetical protein
VAMDVHEWHCNAKLYETPEDKKFNQSIPDIRTRDSETGVIGSEERFQRISFVCYFREKLLDCSEQATRDYYQEIDFNVKEETAKARRASLPSLPIPGITGTVEEAQQAAQSKAVKMRETRKKRRVAMSERLQRKRHFL